MDATGEGVGRTPRSARAASEAEPVARSARGADRAGEGSFRAWRVAGAALDCVRDCCLAALAVRRAAAGAADQALGGSAHPLTSVHVGRFSDALRAGVRAMRDDLGPGRYAAAGRQVRCAHCGGEHFEARNLLLDSRGATLVGLEWLNRDAVALTCATCTAMQWFGGRPERLGA